MGCTGSKQTDDQAQPARTVQQSHKTTGPGRTLGSSSEPTSSSSRPTAGSAAAIAAAKREEAAKANAAKKAKLKPTPAPPDTKDVTDSDTLAWN